MYYLFDICCFGWHGVANLDLAVECEYPSGNIVFEKVAKNCVDYGWYAQPLMRLVLMLLVLILLVLVHLFVVLLVLMGLEIY